MHEYIVLSHYAGRPEIPYVDDIGVMRIRAESHEEALLKYLSEFEGADMDSVEHFDYRKMVEKVLLAGFEGETVWYTIEIDQLPITTARE